jgi:Predicted glycosyl transferase
VGSPDAEAVAAPLAAGARGAPVTVEPATPDYRARLGACAVSVSLFGYNTAVELAQGQAPAVVVPSQAGGEREQTIRARAFAAVCDRFEVIEPPALTPAALAAAVARAAARGPGAAAPIDLGGAARAARILRG